MPDYRWGIFLNNPEAGRQVNFGEHKGEPAWQEYRASTAPTCAGSSSPRATPSRPRSSSSATSA